MQTANETDSGVAAPVPPAGADILDPGPSGWADRQFTLLAVLGAIGVLFHQLQWWTVATGPAQVVLTGSALLVIAKPTSIRLWGVMQLAVVWTVLDEMPWISNHWMFHLLLSGGILLAVGLAWLTGGRKRMSRGEVFIAAGPTARVTILILYFFTTWHKLNWGFLDPDISCGVAYYLGLDDKIRILPRGEWTVWPSIIGTLVWELCLLMLLLIPRARGIGLFVVAGFHLTVGYAHHPNFSSIALGYLVFFMPQETTGRLGDRWQMIALRWGWDRQRLSQWAARWGRMLSWSLAGLALGWMAYAMIDGPWRDTQVVRLLREPWNEDRNRVQKNLRYLFGLYGGAVVMGIYGVGLLGRPWTFPKRYFRLANPVLYVVPLLMLLNGFGPYFGLKNDSAFSMFSNLQTSPNYANHLFIPWTPHLTDWQTDRVTIVESDDPRLADFAQRGHALHWFEFKSYTARKTAAGQGDFSVTYLRGENMTGDPVGDADRATPTMVARVDQDPALNEEFPYLKRKLLLFRPLRAGERNTCGH